MNKIKFETYLREKLVILQQGEIEEIISEYLQHIEMRQAEGLSEEEAIADFGNLNELVKDILDAYKIDTSNDHFEHFSDTIKSWLTMVLNYINRLTSSLMKLSGKEIIALIVEFVLVLILLGALSIVVDIVANNISRIFFFRPVFITNIIRYVIRLLATILNLMISITILYWFANERIINKHQSEENFYQREVKADPIKKNYKDEAKSSNLNFSNVGDINFDAQKQAQKILISNASRKKLEAQANKKPFSQSLSESTQLVLKIIMFLILIPMIVVGVLLGIAFVVVLYNTLIGYGSYGVSLIMIGSMIIYYYVLNVGINFVSGGKSKWKKQ